MRKTVTFGAWAEEPLEWLVLSEDEESLTLWCRRVVKKMAFCEKNSPFYAESDARVFLAGEFFETAFSEGEKARVLPTELNMHESETYYGAITAGALNLRREPITERVFLLSIRDIMKTYSISNDEIYKDGCDMLWARSPFTSGMPSLVDCSDAILRGKDPYTYISESYDYMSDTVKSSKVPHSAYPNRIYGIVPAVRIRK